VASQSSKPFLSAKFLKSYKLILFSIWTSHHALFRPTFDSRVLTSMDYFSKFLKPTQTSPKVQIDHALGFHKSWNAVKVIIPFRLLFDNSPPNACAGESCIGCLSVSCLLTDDFEDF